MWLILQEKDSHEMHTGNIRHIMTMYFFSLTNRQHYFIFLKNIPAEDYKLRQTDIRTCVWILLM